MRSINHEKVSACVSEVSRLAAMAVNFGGDFGQDVLRSCGVLSKELSGLQLLLADEMRERAKEDTENQVLIRDLRDLILQQKTEVERRCERPSEDKQVQSDFEDEVRAAVAAEKSIADASRREIQKDLRIANKEQSQLQVKCQAYEAKIESLNHIIDHLEASLQHKDNIIRTGLHRSSSLPREKKNSVSSLHNDTPKTMKDDRPPRLLDTVPPLYPHRYYHYE